MTTTDASQQILIRSKGGETAAGGVYLDHAATTPLDPRVSAMMWHYLGEGQAFANPSSVHAYGLAAKVAIEEAASMVAALIGAHAAEIIWTSGATEANNLAIKGAAYLYQEKGKHIITTAIEHLATLETCRALEQAGFMVTYLAPNRGGVLEIEHVRQVLRDDTILVSVMHVNNELGTIQPIEQIAAMTAARGILFHVDAAQSVGKLSIDLQHSPIDLLSLSAHKLYGPKGIGALYVRGKPRIRLAPLLHGGGQQRGVRPGTLPTHQIVGMGQACAIAQRAMAEDFANAEQCKAALLTQLQQLTTIVQNGDPAQCSPYIVNVGFQHTAAHTLLTALPQLAISHQSACLGDLHDESHVLRALGLTKSAISRSYRFSFGRFTTLADIARAVYYLASVLS